ncbi:MAG: phosphoribosylformylglycinamidine synthase subunit PurL [Verrucomicrobiota bacterium]
MSEPEITPDLIEKHGITQEEYIRIQEILGRDPNFTELGIFSVMWSEHCSYKNSKPELRKFPTTGDKVLVKAGEENAGVLDIGENMAVSFKIESHNHPSAVEPFQGAATGVGGILRDIFTMGARPVANLNSLRFGPITGDSLESKRNRMLLSGVVKGIAHYGNCIGVPTVGGEVVFDPSYNGNPLVNAFSLGILRHDQIRRGAASGVGNPVFYVGAKTGRDGLAGAAFASRDLTEESKEDRPAVQVGDPFMEKLLLEACLELFEHPEAVVGVQDMGAAGLTCSTIETASRGGSGVEVDLNKVPQRESGMTPYEIMLSESQERMLIIVKKGFEDEVRSIFAKWDLDAAEIGYVTDTGKTVIKVGSEVVADVPARELADDGPVYHREVRKPEKLADLQTFNFEKEIPKPDVASCSQALKTLLGAPSLASKRWIFRQYDQQVQKNTVLVPGSDAAVIRVESEQGGDSRFIAMSADCNGRYCALDPRRGAMIAVAESARNCTMTGALPIGCTDNLNFGNPHDPEIFWQFRESVEGMAEACRAFNTPVTGGNVSLYNQNPRGAIDPTPVMAMVGLMEKEADITPSSFQAAGETILLVGGFGSEMGASAYLFEVLGIKRGLPPEMNLEKEVNFQNSVRELIQKGWVSSAHDLSDGGLAVALAECCFDKQVGASVNLSDCPERMDIALFNESQGRAVLAVESEKVADIQEHLQSREIDMIVLGITNASGHLSIELGSESLNCSIEELCETYESSIPNCMVK